MLQILAKGTYFDEGAALHQTEHRDVLYTNCHFPHGAVIQLPVGELAASTPVSAVSTVTVSITEYLQAESTPSTAERISTGGLELFDDLAVVMSFGLNGIFSRNLDLVRRLVPGSMMPGGTTQATRLFGRMFQGHRWVSQGELDNLKGFMSELLALRRPNYEAAMRAIKRIVGATQRAADDPTLAYVDIVAALESLGAGVEGQLVSWDRMDVARRNLIDDALVGIGEDDADRVRAAIMEADRLGAGARFLAFVLNNVRPSFFREEALGVSNPLRGTELERVARGAYDIRSKNAHELKELRDEAWILGPDFETRIPPFGELMLTHIGLARLARHAVMNYVKNAPSGIDTTFNWRAALPGQLLMLAAPQYWIWRPDGFDHKSVPRYFAGFVQHFVERLAQPEPELTDINDVLERVEKLVPGTAGGPDKEMMVAIYVLWHRVLKPEHHREKAEKFLAKYEAILDPPGLPAFVARLLAMEMPEWTAGEWQTLAAKRRDERSRKNPLPLPPALDAALQVVAAEKLLWQNQVEDARRHASFAVEELPGNRLLLDWEANLGTETALEIDVWELVVQREPHEAQPLTDIIDGQSDEDDDAAEDTE